MPQCTGLINPESRKLQPLPLDRATSHLLFVMSQVGLIFPGYLDVGSSRLPPQLRQFSQGSPCHPFFSCPCSPEDSNQGVAHGLSQAPCTLQLAATALPLPMSQHCSWGQFPTSSRATLGERSLATAKQKLTPLRTVLTQVNLLEYSN